MCGGFFILGLFKNTEIHDQLCFQSWVRGLKHTRMTLLWGFMHVQSYVQHKGIKHAYRHKVLHTHTEPHIAIVTCSYSED